MPVNLSLYRSVLFNPRVAVMLLMGFSSGLPLPLNSGTLQAWLTVVNVDIRTIGIFSLVGIPYALKFLWAPLMDRFAPPWFGRRRGWILVTQVFLAVTIAVMATISPKHAPFLCASLAFLLAFASASQDIVIDAYRTDLLEQKERGMGAAIYVLGYRIAMLVAGALALILSDRLGWHYTYLIMAGCMIMGAGATLSGPEPRVKVQAPHSMEEAIWGPLKDYFSHKGAVAMLALIILYKMGDAYAGALTTTFLIRGAGFSVIDVGMINKGMGLVTTIIGALFGGTLMVKLGLFRSLLFFGVLQMVSNLSFMVLGWLGKNYAMMVFAVAFENLSGGMGTTAFVALLMTLCNPRYSATQFALLSSLSVLGRVFVAPTSGYMVEFVGWPGFFFLTTLAAVPGLILLTKLKQAIMNPPASAGSP